jgi:hypothetical protein
VRFYVLLTEADADVLRARARAERRDVREQAGYMLSCLLRSGNEPDRQPPVSAEPAPPPVTARVVGTAAAGHAC